MDTPIRHILHPTDLTPSSEAAFRHALRLALLTKAKLTVLHVNNEGEDDDWGAFPGVRQQLEQWGLLPKGAGMNDLARTGLQVRKVSLHESDVTDGCLAYEERHPADLFVMATSQREGPLGWPHASVAERVVRASGRPGLLLPHGVEGWVDAKGNIHMHRVLLPAAPPPAPAPPLHTVPQWASMLGVDRMHATLFHAGPAQGLPLAPAPDGVVHWETVNRDAEVVEGIAAASVGQDMLIMATEGRKGIADSLLGSTTERVLRKVRVPMLVVPTVG